MPKFESGVAAATHLIRGEWALDVLACLSDGTMHYSEIAAAIRQSESRGRVLHDSILSRTLQRMERDGLVVRCERRRTFPRSVTYGLTPMARSLIAALAPVATWSRTLSDRKVGAGEHRASS